MINNWISKIREHEKKIFSQGKQDGVIEYICDNIKVKNKFCVEFGYDSNSLTQKYPNTTNLILNKGWNHLLLDSDYHNPKINLYKHLLTSDNICNLFGKYNVPLEPGYISINVDSIDLWLFKALLSKYKACFYSVEMNSNFPIDYAITFPNDTKELWEKDRVYGASLKALNIVANDNGYSLVYAGIRNTSNHTDAFFIRDDLIENCEKPTLESFRDIFKPMHKLCISSRENIMLDYEIWMKTKDIKKSKEGALPICKRYLTKNE